MITDEKYARLTTYTRSGEAKTFPIWLADLGDGTCGFTTWSGSWKAKRLTNDPRVELQASDTRGHINEGSEPLTGTAIIAYDADFVRVRKAIQVKYGFEVTLIRLLVWLKTLFGGGGPTDCAIIITLQD